MEEKEANTVEEQEATEAMAPPWWLRGGAGRTERLLAASSWPLGVDRVRTGSWLASANGLKWLRFPREA